MINKSEYRIVKRGGAYVAEYHDPGLGWDEVSRIGYCIGYGHRCLTIFGAKMLVRRHKRKHPNLSSLVEGVVVWSDDSNYYD